MIWGCCLLYTSVQRILGDVEIDGSLQDHGDLVANGKLAGVGGGADGFKVPVLRVRRFDQVGGDFVRRQAVILVHAGVGAGVGLDVSENGRCV